MRKRPCSYRMRRRTVIGPFHYSVCRNRNVSRGEVEVRDRYVGRAGCRTGDLLTVPRGSAVPRAARTCTARSGAACTGADWFLYRPYQSFRPPVPGRPVPPSVVTRAANGADGADRKVRSCCRLDHIGHQHAVREGAVNCHARTAGGTVFEPAFTVMPSIRKVLPPAWCLWRSMRNLPGTPCRLPAAAMPSRW